MQTNNLRKKRQRCYAQEMHHIVSEKKTKAFASILFLIGLALLSFMDAWWPGIMLVIGIPLAIRQFLLAKFYDMAVTLLVFGGVFFIVQFGFWQNLLLPVLFIVGALYISFQEYFRRTTEPEDEREEDLNEELEEDQQDERK